MLVFTLILLTGVCPAQGNDVTTIVGSKRGRDVDSHDPSKRPRSDGEAATTVAPVKENQHMDPALGVATDAAAAAAAAAAASASAGFAGQLSAGGQVFAIPGADGQSMLQVVPLQLPAQIDASGLGQIDLSQLDPTTLQVRWF